MRDALFILFLLGLLPFCLFRPWTGVLAWAWIGLMNPHRLTWGMAYTLPVAKAVALLTLIGALVTSDKQKLPRERETWLLLTLGFHFTLTSLFAVYPDQAWEEWNRVIKIFLMSIVGLLLLTDRNKLRYFLLTVALSIAFFGIKGGIFGALTGGKYIVFGPPESFISDNNALALAEIMVLPILIFLAGEFSNRWVRYFLYVSAGLTLLSVILSYSRGALLSLVALAIVFFLMSERKGTYLILILALAALLVMLAPAHWFQRMDTIRTYDEDASAMGRINAWWFAYNLALDKPFTGGGFRAFRPALFLKYAPDPYDIHDAHSIYFEVLGEHGFPGLLFFLGLLGFSINSLRGVSRQVRGVDSLAWIVTYAKMLTMCLVAYAVGGAFLGLAYFDLYYYLVVAVILLKVLARRSLDAIESGDRPPPSDLTRLRAMGPVHHAVR